MVAFWHLLPDDGKQQAKHLSCLKDTLIIGTNHCASSRQALSLCLRFLNLYHQLNTLFKNDLHIFGSVLVCAFVLCAVVASLIKAFGQKWSIITLAHTNCSGSGPNVENTATVLPREDYIQICSLWQGQCRVKQTSTRTSRRNLWTLWEVSACVEFQRLLFSKPIKVRSGSASRFGSGERLLSVEWLTLVREPTWSQLTIWASINTKLWRNLGLAETPGHLFHSPCMHGGGGDEPPGRTDSSCSVLWPLLTREGKPASHFTVQGLSKPLDHHCYHQRHGIPH